ncbi:hypothetical protein Pan216_45740 [Planctomycetes bacterium Pan216]|uniref:Uncharacterized protein n=1 Tax=Kolteria novifilia TaxID=2527975 RepID=A0A518B9V6_9BACT|nr:hypothetical protein Pan216_45740 [Planctomycetes bacterium Pan216]
MTPATVVSIVGVSLGILGSFSVMLSLPSILNFYGEALKHHDQAIAGLGRDNREDCVSTFNEPISFATKKSLRWVGFGFGVLFAGFIVQLVGLCLGA